MLHGEYDFTQHPNFLFLSSVPPAHCTSLCVILHDLIYELMVTKYKTIPRFLPNKETHAFASPYMHRFCFQLCVVTLKVDSGQVKLYHIAVTPQFRPNSSILAHLQSIYNGISYDALCLSTTSQLFVNWNWTQVKFDQM